ncbi:ead/Ea22-like family protein [Escherichia coli]|nr:ead/Ea22-like family protein [Escherichia coli]
MTKINYQALREKAEKATSGVWSLEYGEERFDAGDALIHREVVGYLPICRIEGAHPESGFDEDFQMEQQANAEFIAAASPATVLALLDELEKMQAQSSKWCEAFHKAVSVGARYEERIAELEAKLDSADKLQDSAFRHGLQHGFSLGQTDNQAGFEECLSAYGTGKGE